jgi:signal transduction histidine kinase
VKLQLRLALASFALLLLFLATFAGTWYVLGGAPWTRPPQGRVAQVLYKESNRAFRAGGWPLLEQALRWAVFPHISLTGYDVAGVQRLQRGLHLAPDPVAWERLQREPFYEETRWAGIQVWVRLDDGAGRPAGCLRLLLRQRLVDDQRWRYTVLLVCSAALASLVTMLAGLWGSRAISRPIQRLAVATEALSRSDFQHRISPQGWGELRSLAESFNAMADHLEETVDSLRQAKERAEKSEASRRQFLADVSHNLRTPLSAMLGWSEALLDGLAPGEEQMHLENIHRETLYLGQNVQRLLDWSRWEEKPPQLRFEEMPVSEPLMECLQTLQEAAQARDISLQLLGLEDEPRVLADRIRLRELFQLLLENAIHHNAPGTRLEVEFRPCGARLRVIVRDNGPGLPEQLRADLQCRPGGGLGLAIATRVAEAHGGALELLEGPGTALSFTLGRV